MISHFDPFLPTPFTTKVASGETQPRSESQQQNGTEMSLVASDAPFAREVLGDDGGDDEESLDSKSLRMMPDDAKVSAHTITTSGALAHGAGASPLPVSAGAGAALNDVFRHASRCLSNGWNGCHGIGSEWYHLSPRFAKYLAANGNNPLERMIFSFHARLV